MKTIKVDASIIQIDPHDNEKCWQYCPFGYGKKCRIFPGEDQKRGVVVWSNGEGEDIEDWLRCPACVTAIKERL